MKCGVKIVLAVLYKSVAGVSVENSSQSFWLLIARRTAFFLDGASGWSVTPWKAMQNLKFSSHCFQILSVFTPSFKSTSRSNLGTHAFRLARVFDIVLVNKELNWDCETQWIMSVDMLLLDLVPLGMMLPALMIWAFCRRIWVLWVYRLVLTGVCLIRGRCKIKSGLEATQKRDEGLEERQRWRTLSVAGMRWLGKNVSPRLFWCVSDLILIPKCAIVKLLWCVNLIQRQTRVYARHG